MAQAGNHSYHNIPRNPRSRVEIPDDGVQAALVQKTRGGDEVDELVEGIGKQPTVVGGRGEIGDSGPNVRRSSLGG